MKAMRIYTWGTPPVLESIPEPVAAKGRTLVRMHGATVSHLDRSVLSGRFFKQPPLPYTPGTEGAGVVMRSERFPAGTRVWVRGAGLGTVMDGTWCEVISAPDEAIGLLPDGLPMEVGASFFSPCTAAWVALHDVGGLRSGERVVITGVTGAVGSVAAQLAVQAGAHVFALMRDAGATEGLPSGVQPVLSREQMPEGCNLLVDAIGGPGLAQLLTALAPGGRAVLIGYTAGNVSELNIANLIQRDVSVLPLNMLRRESAAREAAPQLLQWLVEGKLELRTERFALSNAASALNWITQRGHRARAVLLPDSTAEARVAR